MNTPVSNSRHVTRMIRGQAVSDGAGVRLNRVIGTQLLPALDPFLMLDEFRSDQADDYLAGFPDHPHRGFETVTYMLAGRMRHRDNHGNEGLLQPGSVQWMTAGRGLVHSEMPEQENGLMQGFQLWINLPARDKMTAPRYQEIEPEAVPVSQPAPGVSAKVIAGELAGVHGPVQASGTQPLYVDLTLEPGATLSVPVTPGHNAFTYVFDGELDAGPEGHRHTVSRGDMAVFGQGDVAELRAGPAGARALLLAGQPLNEPVARYGPFVMNTQAEIQQAFLDYQAGRF